MKRLIYGALVFAISFIAATASAAKPERTPFEWDIFGQYIGDCGDFVLLSDSLIEGWIDLHFDNSGTLKFAIQKQKVAESIIYRADNPSIYLASGPGEVSNDKFYDYEDGVETRWAFSGLGAKLTVPGYGVVFHQAGRTVLDLETFEIIFQAGPSDFVDSVLYGEIGVICDVFRQ